jgi:UDP-glucose 4-epimerase
MANPKTVLVTGCAGFIGSNFVRGFREQFPKATVVGIDDFSGGRRELLDPAVRFYEGSVTDEPLLTRIFKKHQSEYVFHFAALPRVSDTVEHPTKTTVVNIVGTVALLEASKNHGVRRFIYSSSCAIYGDAKKLPTRESENSPAPLSPYGLQKYVGEPFCGIASSLYGLDTVCLRYFNVFGPGQYGGSPYASVICNWLEALYFPNPKQHPFLEGDGRQSRDFCYVSDVVQANVKAMLAPGKLGGEAMNIGQGSRTDLRTVAKLIERYTGRRLNLERRPARPGDVRHAEADIAKAKRLIGYRPTVDFETGLRQTVEWFKTRAR